MKSPPQAPARPRSARSRARPLGETLGDSIRRKSIGLDWLDLIGFGRGVTPPPFQTVATDSSFPFGLLDYVAH